MVHRFEQLTRDLTDVLAAEPGIAVAVLCGPAAAGWVRPDSDIDLAVLFVDHLTPQAPAERRRVEIERCTGRDVDLIVLNHASTIVAHQVVKTGVLLLCPRPDRDQHFIVRLISEYADVTRTRKPIEHAVLAAEGLPADGSRSVSPRATEAPPRWL